MYLSTLQPIMSGNNPTTITRTRIAIYKFLSHDGSTRQLNEQSYKRKELADWFKIKYGEKDNVINSLCSWLKCAVYSTDDYQTDIRVGLTNFASNPTTSATDLEELLSIVSM